MERKIMYPIISIECEYDYCYPTRAHETDAGADLVNKNKTILYNGSRNLIPTGIKVAIPSGFVGLLFPRSSLSKNYIIMTNSVGVIDSEYRGEVMASLMYQGDLDSYTIEQGTRIVQLVVVPIILPKFQRVTQLAETARGTGGFGSTGV